MSKKKARENPSDQIAIWVSSATDWLWGRRKFSRPVDGSVEENQNQMVYLTPLT